MRYVTLIISLLFFTSIFAMSAGDKAKDFKLLSHTGKKVSLSDFKGKVVVLEWFNDGCPFVRKHYDSRHIPNMQKAHQDSKDVVWLSIVSSAKGKQGHLANPSEAKDKYGEENFASDFLLLDHDGSVGRMYAAKTTPQFAIIDKKGIIQYAGAIDSIPSADASDIPKAKNYVELALKDMMAGTKVKIAKTQPYGCSVKY